MVHPDDYPLWAAASAVNLQFDLTFPGGVKPYLVTCQTDIILPFMPCPKLEDANKTENEENENDKHEA